MQRLYTGIRDVDLKILSTLDDQSLLNACMTDKYLAKICQYEPFWYGRYLKNFGEEPAKYKPKERTWKQHYLKTLVDLDKFKEPVQFFRNILWDVKNGFNQSFYVVRGDFSKILEIHPLTEAPDWVINNLFLLKLNISVLVAEDPQKPDVVAKKFSNISPIALLKTVSLYYPEEDYISSFVKIFSNYHPGITDKEQIIDFFNEA